MKTISLLPLFLGLSVAQSQNPECGGPTPGVPSLTVQFTPKYPEQIAPVSTVYDVMLTSYLNVVDCKYVMVQNIDDNQAQSGQFTARTTIPTLTLYRVGCMPETTAITRREYRGYEVTTTSLPQTTSVDFESKPKVHDKRTTLHPSVAMEVLGLAQNLASGIDPTNDNITVREFRYLVQINTALFALNLVNFGFDLNELCEYLKNPSTNERLEDSLINTDQASNIICFAAQYGLYFGMSNNELLADLAALEYAIQMHAYATKSLQELCESLDYTAAGFLGIDTEGIRTYICNGTAGTSTTISQLTSSTTMGTGISTGAGAIGSGIITTANPTGTISIVYGSNGPVASSATSAAGSVAPWYNGTVTANPGRTTVSATAMSDGSHTVTPAIKPLFYAPQLRRQARHHL